MRRLAVMMAIVVMMLLAIAVTCFGDVIYVCVTKNNGGVRIVPDPGACKSNEYSLSWNQTGPQGPKGDTGPAGPVGPAGPASLAELNGTECTLPSGTISTLVVTIAADGTVQLKCKTPDNPPTCGGPSDIDSNDPLTAALVMDIPCQDIVSANWVLPDGTTPTSTISSNYHLGHGLLDGFGPNVKPESGEKLLALSSGTARQLSDPNYVPPENGFVKGYTSGSADGYPELCSGITPGVPNDGIGLQVVLNVPVGVKSLAFDFNYYTTDWPDWVCSGYNDRFVVLLSPNGGNIALDKQANPVSVKSVEACGPPGTYGGIPYTCPLGTSILVGTGFENHGATGWLSALVPVPEGRQITLLFAIWDSGDGSFDSTVLLDNFRWTQ
jgi:hypothetical protein